MNFEELLQLAREKPCLLCGGKSDISAVFVPTGQGNQAMYDAPIGKTRYLFYSLCSRCYGQPDRNKHVEDALQQGLAQNAILN